MLCLCVGVLCDRVASVDIEPRVGRTRVGRTDTLIHIGIERALDVTVAKPCDVRMEVIRAPRFVLV